MSTLNDLNLKRNPFRNITAVMEDQEMIWAGVEETKTKIERSYNDLINNNSKQMVLNWGPYGGGKTFSAFYFTHEMRERDNLTHIYIQCPKDGAKASGDFFKSIIDSLTFEGIHDHIMHLIEEVGEVQLLHYLTPRATREFAKAICLLGSQDDEISELMHRYLYSGLTKTELKKVGLAKAVLNDNDIIRFLSGLLSCFTGNQDINDGRLVLWIDEMEDLIYFSPKYYKGFSQILRDLFNNIPDRSLFFLNFTLAEGEEATVSLILGEALWSRVTKKIRYKHFTQDDAMEYVTSLLNKAKVNKAASKPLNNDVISKIIDNIPISELTPREINKQITSLLSYSLENGLTSINSQVLTDWISDYQDNN